MTERWIERKLSFQVHNTLTNADTYHQRFYASQYSAVHRCVFTDAL